MTFLKSTSSSIIPFQFVIIAWWYTFEAADLEILKAKYFNITKKRANSQTCKDRGRIWDSSSRRDTLGSQRRIWTI